MSSDTTTTPVRVDAGMGIFWFIGWLFTIAFAKLVWWEALIGLVIWPYYLGLAAALAGGLAFLVVDVVVDALGYRVGAPGAERRFTMLTAMMAGNLGAALASGAVIGVLLRRHVLQGALITPLSSAIEAEAI